MNGNISQVAAGQRCAVDDLCGEEKAVEFVLKSYCHLILITVETVNAS